MGGSGLNSGGDQTPGNPDPDKPLDANGVPDWGRGGWMQPSDWSGKLQNLMGAPGADPLTAFTQSDEGKGYSPEIIAAIRSKKNETDANGRVWAKINGSITDISGYINQYNAWASSNVDAATAFSAYQKASKGQPGRDAELLTGATVAPETAIGQVYPQGVSTAPGTAIGGISQGMTNAGRRRQI